MATKRRGTDYMVECATSVGLSGAPLPPGSHHGIGDRGVETGPNRRTPDAGAAADGDETPRRGQLAVVAARGRLGEGAAEIRLTLAAFREARRHSVSPAGSGGWRSRSAASSASGRPAGSARAARSWRGCA